MPSWDVGKDEVQAVGPTFDFVFNGHGLAVGQEHTLIYYQDPWPGTPAICFAGGIANEEGNLHLAASVELDMDLVDSGDPNDGIEGAKIWLVLASDVSCGEAMIGWNPTAYLFEGNGIIFDDTDVQ